MPTLVLLLATAAEGWSATPARLATTAAATARTAPPLLALDRNAQQMQKLRADLGTARSAAAKVPGLERKVASLTRDLKSARTSAAAAASRASRGGGRSTESLERSLKQMTTARDQLRTSEYEKSRELSDAKYEARQAANKVDEAERRLASAEYEVKELQQRIENMSSSRGNEQSEVDTLKAQLREAQSRVDEIDSEMPQVLAFVNWAFSYGVRASRHVETHAVQVLAFLKTKAAAIDSLAKELAESEARANAAGLRAEARHIGTCRRDEPRAEIYRRDIPLVRHTAEMLPPPRREHHDAPPRDLSSMSAR